MKIIDKKILKNLKEIKDEIRRYPCSEKVSKALLALGRRGFRFCGHGVGFGEEDFHVIKEFKNPKFTVNVNIGVGQRTKYYVDAEDNYNSYIKHFGRRLTTTNEMIRTIERNIKKALQIKIS